MKKLEELLDLADSKEIIASEQVVAKHQKLADEFTELKTLDKESNLPSLGIFHDKTDAEFDALAKRATDAYDDLMDLGMNVESRYSGRIFEVASSMLKNAIDAKSAKIDKKLKTIDLQLKKYKMDCDNPDVSSVPVNIAGEGYVVSDRNSLIEKLKNMNKG